MMKKVIRVFGFIALTINIAAMVAVAESNNNKKHSAEHKAAIQKCDGDYKAALRDAQSLKGKEKREAEAAAKAQRKQCYANAPN